MIDEDFVRHGYELDDVIQQYIEDTRKGAWVEEKQVFKKYVKKDMKILDVGCGTGRITFYLSEFSKNIDGIDFSRPMIEAAKTLNIEFGTNINFREGNVLDLQYNNTVFDCVVFAYNGLNTIPEYNNRIKALSEIKRVLKDDGVFIFSSHIRKKIDKKLFFYWFKQYFRIKFLKSNEEIGDRLSFRHNRWQYINIPKMNNLKKTIWKCGFNIIEIVKVKVDKKRYPINLFVCQRREE